VNFDGYRVPKSTISTKIVPSSCKKSLAVESTRTSSFAQLLVLADSTAKDFMQQDGTILVEIVRALYGLPDSAKRWNSHFWWLCAM